MNIHVGKSYAARKKAAAVHLPQYHANITRPTEYKESHIFAIFGLNVLELFCSFLWVLLRCPGAKNYR